MALTKIADLKAKSDDQLRERLVELGKEKFNLRFQRATGQLANLARRGHVRREIAQIKTLLNERARGVKKPAPKAKKKAA